MTNISRILHIRDSDSLTPGNGSKSSDWLFYKHLFTKDIDMLVVETVLKISRNDVYTWLTFPPSWEQSARTQSGPLARGSDLDATCDQPLKLITTFPTLGFWQCARKEQLMTSLPVQNFIEFTTGKTFLSPERLIHLWMKEMERNLGEWFPWYFTQLSWKPFSSFQLV